MPRLPTIRVIGSHAISTSWPGSRLTCDGSGMVVVIETSLSVCDRLHHRVFQAIVELSPAVRAEGDSHLPGASRAGGEFRAALAPPGFFVDRACGDLTQTADHAAVDLGTRRGHLAAGRLIHERHELVREAGHR